MNPYPLIPLLSWLLILFVWSYVLGQRRRDAVNSAFLLFAGVGGAWNGIELLFYLPVFEGMEETILRAVIPLWMSIGFLFLNFAYRLVNRKPDAIYAFFLLATLVGALIDVSTDWILQGHQYYEWGVADIRDPLLHTAICIAPVLAGMFGLMLVFNAWRKTQDSRTKRPMAMVLFGGMATLSAITLLNIVLPNLFGMLAFPRFGASALAVFIFVIFAAVSRYRFLSISVEHVAEELFENVRDGIVLVNRRGRAQRMNRAAIELMGLGTPPGPETPVAHLLPGYSLDEESQNREIILGRGETGRVLSLSQSSNIKQRSGLGKILIIRDVTEQKRAEDLLRRSHDELEQEVRRRTEELRQSQKMEAIGTLAGGIAHDFNNLLAAILGFATAARDDMSREHPLRSDLEEVVIAARRARDIVQQLLTFSKKGEPERTIVAMDQLLAEALKLLEVSLPSTMAIRRDIGDDDCMVLGDPGQLHQVVMNLCTNAYQAMGQAGGELGVALEVIELDQAFAGAHPPLKPTRHVHVTISDTGHGMTRETIDRIFDPFFTTKSEGGGTGLGLATVQRIVADHTGVIVVESEIGAGSRFSVYLPWAEGDPSLEDSTSLPVEGGNERIMFIDDREQVARASKRLLQTLGYRVETYTSPTEALEVFGREPRAFDMAITDQVMPEMTGLELAGEMLRIRPQLPIILVSGNADAELKIRARDLGIGSFLSKPLSKGSAARVIRALLDANQFSTPR
ncbi:MAG: response regulator [Deltaproteobacteria bacterium]|nr:response regulator [Deltaproteobacteria bacterium]